MQNAPTKGEGTKPRQGKMGPDRLPAPETNHLPAIQRCWAGRPQSIHTVGYYSVPKRKGSLTHAAVWMDHETRWRERSQTQKSTQCRIPFL